MVTPDASRFDVLVLGAGNAGRAAASAAKSAGASTAIVEEDVVGGTCPNRGCVPKKVLVTACTLVDHARRAQGKGVTGELRIDWSALQRHRASIVDPIHVGMEESLAKSGITLVRGHARFVAPHVVEVGGRRIEARKIVIATGSAPSRLGFPGEELLATSDVFLAMPSEPRTACFVGAGVVAMELAHVLVRAGCERVVLLQRGPRPLPKWDAEVVDALVAHGKELGIEVRTKVDVLGVTKQGERFVVTMRDAEPLVVDRVFHGAGRAPRVDGLGLDAAGIPAPHGRVALRKDLRTEADADVALVGDAAPGLPQLSPLASSLGALVAENLVHERHDEPDLRFVPRCVYAIPTLAQVGLTEEEARAKGLAIEVHTTKGIPSWISGRTHHEAAAIAKVITRKDDGTILGAHLLREAADETIHVFAMAMRQGLTAKALGAVDAAYPTFAADVTYFV